MSDTESISTTITKLGNQFGASIHFVSSGLIMYKCSAQGQIRNLRDTLLESIPVMCRMSFYASRRKIQSNVPRLDIDGLHAGGAYCL